MRKLLLLLSLVFAQPTFGASTGSTQGVMIKDVIYYSKQESIYPAWKGLVQVRFNDTIWSNNGKCRTTTVAIRNEDTHLYSAALTAYTTGKMIHLYADDSLNVESDICFLRALSL